MKKKHLAIIFIVLYFVVSYFGLFFAQNMGKNVNKLENIILKIANTEDIKVAKNIINIAQQRNEAEFQKEINNGVINKAIDQKSLFSIVPNSKEIESHIISYNYNVNSNTNNGTHKTISMSFEYRYPDIIAYYNIAIDADNDKHVVNGLNAEFSKERISDKYKFRLFHLKPLDYVILIASLILTSFTMYVFYDACFRENIKYRWLWLVLISQGFPLFKYSFFDQTLYFNFGFNGNYELSHAPISSFTQMLFFPAFMNFCIPYVAIIYLFLWLRKKAEAN